MKFFFMSLFCNTQAVSPSMMHDIVDEATALEHSP